MQSRHGLQGVLLVLPTAAVIFGFIFFPIGYSVWLSFTSKHTISPEYAYVGFNNYVGLTQDPEFWLSLWQGIIFAGGSIFFQVTIGLAVALFLNQNFFGRGFLRGITLFPYMMPTIVVVLLWRWLLSATYGPVNYLLMALGVVETPIVWLNESMIMTSTIFVAVWHYFPFVVMGILSRLQTIDLELYEAAEIDGANAWKRFAYITLPEIRFVLIVLILLRTFFMFTKFDMPWLMGSGGALQRSVQNLPVYAYRRTFGLFRVGEGAAVSVSLFCMLVVLTIVYFRLFRKET